MSVALRGNLRDFGISDVFQLIGQQRKTGMLSFRGGRSGVQILFDRGAVVWAAPARGAPHAELSDMLVRCGLLTRDRVNELQRECEASAQPLSRLAAAKGWLGESEVQEIEDLLTRETIFDLLRWSEGSFDFHAQPAEHDRPPSSLLPAEQILMDGLRMVDEWQSFAEHVPSDDLVFRRVGDFESYRRAARPEMRRQLEAAERIFYLVDGRLSARRVIDLSLLGTFDATRLLADLRGCGMIEPLDPEMAERLRRRLLRDAGAPRPARTWLAALVPLALLAVVIGLTRTPAREEATALRIERDALGAVHEAYAERRVRNALDTWRFSRGGAPARLDDLVAEGLLPPDALASTSGRPYYYRQRRGAVVLLPPER